MKNQQENKSISENTKEIKTSVENEGSEKEVSLFKDGNKSRLAVYIWFDRGDTEDIGHVSLQTNLAYWSFWPRLREEDSCLDENLNTKTSYEEEVSQCNRGADLCICLYELLYTDLDHEFERLLGRTVQRRTYWTSLNRNQLFAKPKKGSNCYTLIARLFLERDQHNSYGLKGKKRKGKFDEADVDSAEKLADLMMMMKKRELKLYPKTKNYSYIYESEVTKKCSIM